MLFVLIILVICQEFDIHTGGKLRTEDVLIATTLFIVECEFLRFVQI